MALGRLRSDLLVLFVVEEREEDHEGREERNRMDRHPERLPATGEVPVDDLAYDYSELDLKSNRLSCFFNN